MTGVEVGNPRSAVARYLKNTVTLAEGRVFRPELPKSEDDDMPRACIVVVAAGGGHMFGGDRLPAFDSLMDINCYGSTRLEAEDVADEAQYWLRELAHETFEGTLLHWARIVGAVKSTVDKETMWPYAPVEIQVMHSIP
jgi:hypothetical protein